MTLRVLNTLSGEREEFEPADPDDVLLYYCGLTVSDYPHLGHARTWTHVDVIHRWLDHLGYGVRHVENITDVNEKIAARIGERTDGDTLGDSESDVARHFIEQLLTDMRSLNLKRAEVYPRVSEHVPEIIDLIETLIEKGYAYESEGSVYFDVTEFPDYGKLSNQELEEVEAQGPDEEHAEKRHPADFALWKAGGVDENAIEEHRNEDEVILAGMKSKRWRHNEEKGYITGPHLADVPEYIFEAEVDIGDGCSIGHHAVIEGPARIGRDNRIFPHAYLGAAPQDLGYQGEPTRLEIGERNLIREFVTIHRATTKDQRVTRIGNDNMFMAYAHSGWL
jgi:carbonic anhydrase/acetyltransferase-like protein (isoleucine patch superfamily)